MMRKPGIRSLEASKALRKLHKAKISLRAVLDTVERQTYASAAERTAFERVACAVRQMLAPYADAQEAIVKAQQGNLGSG